MRRNNLYIIALFVYCVVALAGCVKNEIRNIDSRGKNIICFGDSITFGYGVNPGEDYPSVMSKMTDLHVINAGIDGDTTTEALKRIDSDVLDREPLLVIVEFCGNDFLRNVPAEVSVANIREMVKKIQARKAIVAIADISAGLFLRDYRSLLSKVAKEERAIFIPAVLNGIITNPSMKSDFLHPNAEGYKLVAERIYHAVLPYLQQKSPSIK